MEYQHYPREALEDIVRIRRRILNSGVPSKETDRNLIIATWNIRTLSDYFHGWSENTGSPKRNRRALACIAEIISRFDVVAVQEVKRDTSALRTLVAEFLGQPWDLILSDVTVGDAGNAERLAFVFDRRRVVPSGLAGEIVLPPTDNGDPSEQFDRSPYIVGFETSGVGFTLLTAHIRYGETPDDRLGELRAMADFTARHIRERAVSDFESRNLIVLGDFNIEKRGDNPLFAAFTSTGLNVPPQLLDVKTTYGRDAKHYDQIAWFMGFTDLPYSGRAGTVDFIGAAFQNLPPSQVSYRISDHFPLWAEFRIDRSNEQIIAALGLDQNIPDPLALVPD